MAITLAQARQAGRIAEQMPAVQAAIDQMQATIATGTSFTSLQINLSDGTNFVTSDLGLSPAESAAVMNDIIQRLRAKLVVFNQQLAVL